MTTYRRRDQLDEQPGLTVWGNVLDAEYEDLRIRLPVEAVWEETDDPEIVMVQWRPVGGDSSTDMPE